MVTVKRALISVSDKTGIVDFARVLRDFGVEIISTGGTAKLLQENGVAVKEIAEYTGFPEMLDGRVKTLHPAVHAGLLAVRSDSAHMRTLSEYHIGLIDMVVVNLYPFEKTVARAGAGLDEAIENIDIGGPAMLRSAAKNHESVAVVCNPARYPDVVEAMRAGGGAIPVELLRELAVEVFAAVSRYDAAIHAYLGGVYRPAGAVSAFPARLALDFEKIQELRYGENPHQRAALYRERGSPGGIVDFRQLHGKELSFNNILDLNAAFELVKEFPEPAAAIVKHNNPCGAALGSSAAEAYRAAWRCDPLSAFGGIVAFNRPVDAAAAAALLKSGFLECIVAPAFSGEALKLLSGKKNVRLIACAHLQPVEEFDYKRVGGGLLVQDKDAGVLAATAFTCPTKKKPTPRQMESLLFAWRVAKHVKSNAIVISRGAKTVGIGAGQMSRVDSALIAVRKAGARARGAVLASDAFFPKADSIAVAAKAGVAALIQPGGSIADAEVIRACDVHKLGMVFTHSRHFKH